MWWLYKLSVGVALLFWSPILLARWRHYRATIRGRLGVGAPRSAPGALWLHAVSVGETAVAATLASGLPAIPTLVTTTTPTGQARARQLFAGGTTVDYFPAELDGAVRRFFDRHQPAALVLVEGDYWPLVQRLARRRGLPVAVVNGRVGDRSFARWRRLRPLARRLLGTVDRFAVQATVDRERLIALGVAAERVEVTGNLKFDTPEPEPRPDLEALLAGLANGRPLFACGSTMSGEERRVLDAFVAAGGGEAALLLLAPRHPERWDAVALEVERRGLGLARRSCLPRGSEAQPAVVLLDSMGELAAIYRFSAVAFVGGTLVPTGGHNPIEAARFGCPVVVGPSMENFRDLARLFDAAGGWARVGDEEELGRLWQRWLERPEEAQAVGRRGRELVERHRGAVERTVEALRPLLAGRFPQLRGGGGR